MLSSSTTCNLRGAYQFDLHARYSKLAEILTSALAGAAAPRVLDVGAGPQRLTEEFLPDGFATVTRTDVSTYGDEGIILTPANAALPFADGEFDAVVAMDVLEHVPAEGREFFLRECLRVAKTVAVIAAPIGSEAVREAERDYAQAFRHLFAADEPFLVEHETFGLPDPQRVHSTLEAAGAAVVTLDNVRLADWLALNVVNLVLSTINDGDEVRSAVATMQNAAIQTSEPGAQHYRRFFIASRDPQVVSSLAARLPEGEGEAAPADRSRVTALQVLADEFKRYVTRYHGPTLEAVLADRDLSIKTQSDVVADKDRHIGQLQAVADGMSERLRSDELRIEQMAAAMADQEQALRAAREALRTAQDTLQQERDRALRARVRRLLLRLRGEPRPAKAAG